MKFALPQLRNFRFPYSFEETIDLSNELVGFEDIVGCKPCEVSTTIYERGEETFLCEFKFKIELTLIDAISANEIPYVIEESCEELFSTDDRYEDAFMIEGITLDTKDALVTNILSNKPMAYTIEDYEEYEESDETEVEEKINPAFAGLKDLLK